MNGSCVALLSSTMTLALLACDPTLDDAAWRIDDVRVLAVRAEPPEADPGQSVTFAALVASPDGTVASPELAWSFCSAPKPIAENNVVDDACLGDGNMPIPGRGRGVTATIPANACQLFGPDPPPGDLRPRDPDVTGGYYQPVVLQGAGAPVVALERVRCNLARTSPEIAREYRMRYARNVNPTLLPLVVRVEGAPAALEALPGGSSVELEASWTTTSAESFVALDPRSQTLAERCETLTVSWFTTRGTLETRRTGVSACAGAHAVENRLTLPDEPGPLHLWLVLRDDRGGVDFRAYDAEIVR